MGVLVRNLRTVKAVYWVNVSESSGTSLPGLSWINRCKMLLLLLLFWHCHVMLKKINPSIL